MKNKLSIRKAKQTLLLKWSEGREFAVPVAVRPPTEPRLLKNYTIAIQLRTPAPTPRPRAVLSLKAQTY